MKDDDRIQDAALREQARRLGVAEAQRLDVERVVAGVLDRLRHERRPAALPSRVWRSGWMRVAAALVVVVGAGVAVRQAWQQPRQTALVVDELQDLSVEQLGEVLGSLDETLKTPIPESGTEDINDLTTQQLETLLRSLEG
jgi:hypothetical protein